MFVRSILYRPRKDYFRLCFSQDNSKWRHLIVPTKTTRKEDLTPAQLAWFNTYCDLDKQIDKVLAEHSELRQKVLRALYAFNTTKQLFASWPEITVEVNKALVSMGMADGKNAAVPAVQIRELNEEIGLPSAAQKAKKESK